MSLLVTTYTRHIHIKALLYLILKQLLPREKALEGPLVALS